MIKLSNIGEKLVSKMIEESPSVQGLFGKHTTLVTETGNELRVESEVHLCRCGPYGFDGAHRLDVALLLGRTKTCLGIEVKLGRERLARRQFEDRFLETCGMSHDNTRMTGSMTAILDGRLPDLCKSHQIFARHEQALYRLLPTWFLVVRKRTLEAWSPDRGPGLSCNCAIIAFEEIVRQYGGCEEFNSLVAKLVGGDYYREWIEDA